MPEPTGPESGRCASERDNVFTGGTFSRNQVEWKNGMLKLWPFFRFVSRREPTTEAEGSAGLLPATLGRTRSKLLPYIEIETSTNHHKSFTSPNPDINATVYSSDRVPVGHITYAVSPLFDRLYIFDITIHDAYRRRGFGLAVMSYLATTYRLPITTIKEVSQASGFWHSARLAGAPIDTLSFSEMDTEAERWAHLKPHADKLELLISDRLFRNREAWETAVGRGLPDWPSSTPGGPGAHEQP